MLLLLLLVMLSISAVLRRRQNVVNRDNREPLITAKKALLGISSIVGAFWTDLPRTIAQIGKQLLIDNRKVILAFLWSIPF